jgi:hypothetical protein
MEIDKLVEYKYMVGSIKSHITINIRLKVSALRTLSSNNII